MHRGITNVEVCNIYRVYVCSRSSFFAHKRKVKLTIKSPIEFWEERYILFMQKILVVAFNLYSDASCVPLEHSSNWFEMSVHLVPSSHCELLKGLVKCYKFESRKPNQSW